jgi:hypothetical protein
VRLSTGRRVGFVVVAIATVGVGCDDSPLGPASGTRVEATIQDSPLGTPTVTGTYAGNVHASVGTSDRWSDFGSPNGITFPIQIIGRVTTVHGEASVASGAYNRVRLVLQGVTARLASGSNVGGTVLTSDRTITLGGSDERVELSVPVSTFTVETDARVRHVVSFDLRSQEWLTAAAVQAGRVEDGPLQSAVAATVRVEDR